MSPDPALLPEKRGPQPGRCARCFLQLRLCACSLIPAVTTRTRFVIVRHAAETWKTSNTGRLAALALTNSELLDYGRDGHRFSEDLLSGRHAWLLYPGGSAALPRVDPPAEIVVLDATWQQARRMTQRITILRGMPRLSLPPPLPGTMRMRTGSRPEEMSTLEAIAHAVELLEGKVLSEPLERLHAEVVLRARASGR
ncbi:MAG: DTW domain-containing protein [Deltaproteobacteria bacterium]|nr:DTW domain-containing protein [Deltaproteobacteria bacterium]